MVGCTPSDHRGLHQCAANLLESQCPRASLQSSHQHHRSTGDIQPIGRSHELALYYGLAGLDFPFGVDLTAAEIDEVRAGLDPVLRVVRPGDGAELGIADRQQEQIAKEGLPAARSCARQV